MHSNDRLFRLGTSGVLGVCLLLGGAAPRLEAQGGPQGTAAPAAETYGAWGIDLSGMDTRVRPQDDFYRFVNGGWLERTEIPADRSNYGAFTSSRDRAEGGVARDRRGSRGAPAGAT